MLETCLNMLRNMRELLERMARAENDDPRSAGIIQFAEKDFGPLIEKLENLLDAAPKPVPQKPAPTTPQAPAASPLTAGRAPWIQVFSQKSVAEALSKPLEGNDAEVRQHITGLRDAIIAGPDELDAEQAARLVEILTKIRTEGTTEFDAIPAAFKPVFEKERINVFPDEADSLADYVSTGDVVVKKEFSDSVPKNELISVESLGLIKGAVCLHKAAVTVSRGPQTAEMRLFADLQDIKDYIDSKNIVVDNKLTAFIQRAKQVVDEPSDIDWSGDHGLKIIVDSFSLLEKLADTASDEGLRSVMGRVALRFVAFLKTKGFLFFPEEGNLPQAVDETRFETKKEYADKPEGGIIRVGARGIEYKGNIVRKARVLVSGGPPPEIYLLLKEAGEAVRRVVTDASKRPAAAKGLKSIAEWLSMIPEKDPAMHPDFARYAVGVLDELNESGKLGRVTDKLLAFLKKNGYNELMVVTGDMFDESYSPSKYERRKLPSDEPPGKIIKLIRRGFVDRDGLPVQKAIVGISGQGG